MNKPSFNMQGQTIDADTIKLAALANVIGQHPTGADLNEKLNDIANKLKAGSAVNAVINQTQFNTALTAVNGGASSVLPIGNGAIVIPTYTLPATPLDNAGSGTGGGAVPTITGFSPISGIAGSTVTITGTNLGLGFQPAPIVAFGTTDVTTALVPNGQTSITAAVPAGLAAGTYSITIRGATGAPIAVGTYTVTAPALAAPTGVTATAVSSSEINLSWNAVPGAVQYRFHRTTTPGVAWSAASPLLFPYTTALTYNDTGLAPDTTYYYKIVAVNAQGYTFSAEVSATTQAAAGSFPTGYILQGGLTWAPPVGMSDKYLNTYCSTVKVNGTGWRLPTQPELSALHLSGRVASAVKVVGSGWSAPYNSIQLWSSSPYNIANPNPNYHYMVDVISGQYFAKSVGYSTTSLTCVIPNNTMDATNETSMVKNMYVGTPMTNITPLVAVGGVAPYTYSYTGTLPAGLSFDSNTGVLSGTPTAVYATANTVFSVKDANNVVASPTSTISFTVDSVTWPAGYVAQGELMWMPVSATNYTYTQANTLCAGNMNGLNGWRLPTQTELSSLSISGLMNGQGWDLTSYVWTSSGQSVYLPTNSFQPLAATPQTTRTEKATCVR